MTFPDRCRRFRLRQRPSVRRPGTPACAPPNGVGACSERSGNDAMWPYRSAVHNTIAVPDRRLGGQRGCCSTEERSRLAIYRFAMVQTCDTRRRSADKADRQAARSSLPRITALSSGAPRACARRPREARQGRYRCVRVGRPDPPLQAFRDRAVERLWLQRRSTATGGERPHVPAGARRRAQLWKSGAPRRDRAAH